jgi:predicted AlkP superfamily pyrophosphatase or phosphodiesterase
VFKRLPSRAAAPILFLGLLSPLGRYLSLSGKGDTPISTKPPKLIVAIVIDQLRYDYLVRFRPYFTQKGFNLLLGGAVFTDCTYDYATTTTCPGHATLFTGAYSNVHGIIGNEWYDRALGRKVYCVEDAAEKLVGGASRAGFSPRKLVGTTFGDELRMATGFKSRVVSVSLKDRASVIPGGHLANAAYWYDAATGHFVSSTYYMQNLPAWATAFNDSAPAKTYCGKAWQALPEMPEASGKMLAQFKPEANEPCPDPKFLAWLNSTPYMAELELNFAGQLVKNEHLGQGPVTDLLAVSLSVNDYIGHAFGPYSDQVADTTLRTDRYLADFFSHLEQTVGLENVWITLSADHGVSPNHKYIREHRLSPNRPFRSVVDEAVEHGLSQAYGQAEWIQDSDGFYIDLNRSALKQHQLDPDQAAMVAADAASGVPGVWTAFTRRQFLGGNLPRTPLARKASNSYNLQRSGDVFIVLDPFASPVEGEIETTHGSPWSYDSQVPLIFWGAAFKPGVYATPVQPIDFASTLAAALAITRPSGAQGRPLSEVLK